MQNACSTKHRQHLAATHIPESAENQRKYTDAQTTAISLAFQDIVDRFLANIWIRFAVAESHLHKYGKHTSHTNIPQNMLVPLFARQSRTSTRGSEAAALNLHRPTSVNCTSISDSMPQVPCTFAVCVFVCRRTRYSGANGDDDLNINARPWNTTTNTNIYTYILGDTLRNH